MALKLYAIAYIRTKASCLENICPHETYQKAQLYINGIKALHLFHFRVIVVVNKLGESMKKIRSYWRNPSLTSGLSREEKQKITGKFMELLAKDRKKNAAWFSKVMKERNKNLPHTCARGS